jgi:hypothetical protein
MNEYCKKDKLTQNCRNLEKAPGTPVDAHKNIHIPSFANIGIDITLVQTPNRAVAIQAG